LNLIQVILAKGQYMSKRFPTKILAETSVVVALSFILKDILPPIYRLPQGGSITIAGLVPLIWFSLRRGVRYSVFAGFIFGFIHMVFGGYVINPFQGLIDYPIAYAAIGLAGLSKKYPLIGVGIGIMGRFLISFLSGILFFTGTTIEGILASAIYNGIYLIGEFVITIIVIYLLIKRRLIDIYI
ncbi:energy-coupled thiamine transporter ThiT, partial [Candidatus Bathyarchaeota archaeon]|nr:energy-coupled thiamine transporter ThiT [Candidatus Bathyarchaeota archaeon]